MVPGPVLPSFAARAFGCLLVLVVVFSAKLASAQLHWDTGLSVGPMRRTLIGGASDSSLGPTAVLEGHVALFPLLRVGAYGTFDFAKVASEPDARFGGSFGLHAKVAVPGMPKSWKGALFLGLGYALLASAAHERLFIRTNVRERIAVPGATGGMLEIPFGFQAAYKASQRFHLIFQLGVRFGFANHGELFDGRVAKTVPIGNELVLPSAGAASLSPFLLVGVSFDR